MVRALVLSACIAVFAAVAGAQSYSVSSGSLSGYSDIASPQKIALKAGSLSSVISPTGFSFSYFGTTYTDFKVGANGYIIMGTNGTTVAKDPAHGTAPGLVISPLWNYLEPGASLVAPLSPTLPAAGTVNWEFSGGILAVEWKNVPTATDHAIGVHMKALLDTSSGEIEFDYGSVPSGTTGAIEKYAHAMAISGPTGATQEIVDGDIANYTGSTGDVTKYPAGQWVLFTPGGTPANTPPTISVSQGGGQLTDGDTVGANYNDSVASLNIVLDVDDANGDPVTCTASISNLGSTGIVVTEWEMTSGSVPYSLTPTTGNFNDPAGVVYDIDLTVDDGTDNATFTFHINQSPQSSSAPAMSVSDGATVSYGQGATGTNRDFGSQDVGAGQTAALTITISNSGSADLTLSNFNLTGDSGDFVLDANSVTSPLGAGNSTTFTIAFDPVTAGQKVAQVNFDHNDTSFTTPFSFEVTGLGTQTTPVPILVVRETDVSGNVIANGSGVAGIRDFGSMDIASTPSAPITIFVQNAGSATLTLGTPGSSNADFSVNASGLPASLSAGSSATFTVTFTPAATGAKSATISFTSNDPTPGSTFTFDVSGTATSGGGSGGTGGLSGGSGGGGGGCVAVVDAWDFLLFLLALGASLGARTLWLRVAR